MTAAVITPCSHLFHAGCLKKWLYVQETCPLCHNQLKGSLQSGSSTQDALLQEPPIQPAGDLDPSQHPEPDSTLQVPQQDDTTLASASDLTAGLKDDGDLLPAPPPNPKTCLEPNPTPHTAGQKTVLQQRVWRETVSPLCDWWNAPETSIQSKSFYRPPLIQKITESRAQKLIWGEKIHFTPSTSGSTKTPALPHPLLWNYNLQRTPTWMWSCDPSI